MEGLIDEGAELIDEIERGPVLDVGLVAAAQRVEHYEIAAYGSLRAIGKQPGFTEGAKLFKAIPDEEKATDLKRSESAEGRGTRRQQPPDTGGCLGQSRLVLGRRAR